MIIMKTLFYAIWLFIVLYTLELLEVPRDIFYLLIAAPIGVGGAFLISYLFDRRGNKTNKK